MAIRFNRIHQLCEYLHLGKNADFKCKGCPAWEPPEPGYEEYGPTQRGCYGLAKEAYNIARTGNPWGKPPGSPHDRSYRERIRKRLQRRARKPPTLRIVK